MHENSPLPGKPKHEEVLLRDDAEKVHQDPKTKIPEEGGERFF